MTRFIVYNYAKAAQKMWKHNPKQKQFSIKNSTVTAEFQEKKNATTLYNTHHLSPEFILLTYFCDMSVLDILGWIPLSQYFSYHQVKIIIEIHKPCDL